MSVTVLHADAREALRDMDDIKRRVAHVSGADTPLYAP